MLITLYPKTTIQAIFLFPINVLTVNYLSPNLTVKNF